ncbi:hypothetical protein [Rhizobium mayense]|uniref:Uncharacterized protein n=1 Tax=Rhizobium mayense TaxID=1312184 RepID=A0ABT7K3M8_9HYPH|nr:hypothetical protein [Rhizobium mayense]MDL2402573.1 hypothetical protein [Rhizobium mayense]
MKQHARDDLQKIAKVDQDFLNREMSRTQRLERWIDLLERSPRQFLSTLRETEFQPSETRAAMRTDSSPISVAFADPVLRAAGLENDSYGEAKRFFELTDHELHGIVCYCHFGETVSSSVVARSIRPLLAGRPPSLFARLRRMLTI